MSSPDRIEQQVLLKAPRTKVWKALSNAEAFGEWFCVNLEGQTFEVGKRTRGPITHKGYEHVMWDVLVERIEPERLIAWRWHPYAIDPKVDYSQETPTLVTFELKDVEGGTLLKLTESGFDQVPAARRLEAFRMNSGGWNAQMVNIEKYVARSSGANPGALP